MRNPPGHLFQASPNGPETWGEEEEVEARHPASPWSMQLHENNKSPYPKDSIPVVCDTLLYYVEHVEP